jgi:membrane protein
LFFAAKWVIILGLFYFIIAFIYYFAPAKKLNWRFFSIGSILATGLTILISVGFSYYINNFGQYNKLYGSIGTLIVILMWMYWNSMVLLIGYELNVSIKNAEMSNQELIKSRTK